MNSVSFPLRQPCPPGACTCEREQVLSDPNADWRALRLTRDEEKKLLLRLEAITSLADLRHMQAKLQDLLGIQLHVLPGRNEVRTVRGLRIEVVEQAGLCRKIRQSIPAAVRRALDQRPEIVFALLDEQGLFGSSGQP